MNECHSSMVTMVACFLLRSRVQIQAKEIITNSEYKGIIIQV